MTLASAPATPSKVLWLSFRTITFHESPSPSPGPEVRGFSIVAGIPVNVMAIATGRRRDGGRPKAGKGRTGQG